MQYIRMDMDLTSSIKPKGEDNNCNNKVEMKKKCVRVCESILSVMCYLV